MWVINAARDPLFGEQSLQLQPVLLLLNRGSLEHQLRAAGLILAPCWRPERAAARVALVANPDPAELAALPALEWVQSLWAGVERIVAELPESLKVVRLVSQK